MTDFTPRLLHWQIDTYVSSGTEQAVDYLLNHLFLMLVMSLMLCPILYTVCLVWRYITTSSFTCAKLCHAAVAMIHDSFERRKCPSRRDLFWTLFGEVSDAKITVPFYSVQVFSVRENGRHRRIFRFLSVLLPRSSMLLQHVSLCGLYRWVSVQSQGCFNSSVENANPWLKDYACSCQSRETKFHPAIFNVVISRATKQEQNITRLWLLM